MTSSPICTASDHVCQLDVETGCPSCYRTCHGNCDSSLCEFIPCGFCASRGSVLDERFLCLVTHESSELCVSAQTDTLGCHACGREGCWSSSPRCHALCTATRHVCGSRPGEGCESCDYLCHLNSADARCPFLRPRGHLEWQPTAQHLLDAQAGTGGALPHIFQIDWCFGPPTSRGDRTVIVDGVRYYVGRGDPGRARDGEFNNCLIDSVRQCLGVQVDRKVVLADSVRD